MLVETKLLIIYSAYILAAHLYCYRHAQFRVKRSLSILWWRAKITVSVLLINLLGGCLPRKKTEVEVPPMRHFQHYITDEKRTYSCVHCRAQLASHVNLISKSFQGSQGRAYLFDQVVNVSTGPAEERVLLTGLHHVADIYCQSCKTTLGWKYEHAFETSQKYKEGKFIIELVHMFKDNGWKNGSP